ncbi:MAG: S9 family peptidase [Sphingobacteriales bacterium]|nr:S9 family peptidase [Sphingobacteriales bacterium]MBP9142063.1 S9 family peptidase [Chitinophagales bacterium]MDA0199013.1 S9 family peptidase [Bacteroidota bacterium]MBK6890125.1 S9 family peptidase [Sphingobacteriales bacterium]MBK7527349.1 S9 family peptidase [Sphingobacteriales bacterium]
MQIPFTPTIPLEDFFKMPEKTGFAISPNGQNIAWLAPYANRLNVYTALIEHPEEKHLLTNSTDRNIAGCFWGNDDYILYLKDTDGDENFRLYSVHKSGLEDAVLLTPFDGIKVNIIDLLLNGHQDEILITHNHRDKRHFDVYKLNIRTSQAELVLENPGGYLSFTCDQEGAVRMVTLVEGATTYICHRKTAQDKFEKILSFSFKDSFEAIAFDANNEHIYALSNINRDKAALVRYDIANNKELDLIFEHPEVDCTGCRISRLTWKPQAVIYEAWKQEMHFLDADFAQNYQQLKSLLPNNQLEIAVISRSLDEKIWLVRTYSDRQLGSFYVYNTTTNTLQFLADNSPWMDKYELAEMRPIKYTTRDGLTVHGYLTLPVGVEASKLPVVVNPHGGPWARDHWGFNPEVQFLANRGYAVLQMNFRGSVGFGRKFWEASFKQWGLTMQNDITDGVQWLIEQGIADPQRIAIYGASYGGYATLAGITFTPNLYACAIDYVGVSNLFTFMKSIPPYWEVFLDQMYQMVGHPEHDKDYFTAASPVFHVNNIKVPLFIAQGAKDPRVNINESDQVVEALQKRGVTINYMVKDNEGHGFLNQENKFEFYKAMEEFLATHLLVDEKAAFAA